jgi:hypothetical protein
VELMRLQEDMCQPGCMQFIAGKANSLGVPPPRHSHEHEDSMEVCHPT